MDGIGDDVDALGTTPCSVAPRGLLHPTVCIVAESQFLNLPLPSVPVSFSSVPLLSLASVLLLLHLHVLLFYSTSYSSFFSSCPLRSSSSLHL